MIVKDLAPKQLTKIAMQLCCFRPGTSVVIVVDSPRLVEQNYLLGPDGLLQLARVCTGVEYRQAACRLQFKNGSSAQFLVLRDERDCEKMMGLEPTVFMIDRHSLFLQRIHLWIVQRDRSGFTMQMYKDIMASVWAAIAGSLLEPIEVFTTKESA